MRRRSLAGVSGFVLLVVLVGCTSAGPSEASRSTGPATSAAFTAMDIVDAWMAQPDEHHFYCSTARRRPRYAFKQLRETYLKGYAGSLDELPPFRDVWAELISRC